MNGANMPRLLLMSTSDRCEFLGNGTMWSDASFSVLEGVVSNG